MKRTGLISLTVLAPLAMITLGAVSASTSKPDVQAQITALQDRIADLEKRVDALESQAQRNGLAIRPHIQPLPGQPTRPWWMQPQPNQPAMPLPSPVTPKRYWQKKSFNGMDYYVVPLHGDAPQGQPEAYPTEKEEP